jgi:hypothetical protein
MEVSRSLAWGEGLAYAETATRMQLWSPCATDKAPRTKVEVP